jgi:hypothetical protein
MGMDLKVSLDFYFEMDHSVKFEHKETKYRCENIDCEDHKRSSIFKNANFCSKCGKAIENILVSSGNKFPNPHEFLANHLPGSEIVTTFNEDSGIEDCYWQYNYSSETLERIIGDFDVECGGILNLNDFNAKQLINDFKKEAPVAHLIEVFERIYGVGTLQVKAGLIASHG